MGIRHAELKLLEPAEPRERFAAISGEGVVAHASGRTHVSQREKLKVSSIADPPPPLP